VAECVPVCCCVCAVLWQLHLQRETEIHFVRTNSALHLVYFTLERLCHNTHTRTLAHTHTHWQTSDRHTRGHQNGIGSRRVWPKIVTVFLLQQLKKSQKKSQLQSTSLLLLPLPLPLQSPTSVSVGQLPLASFSVHFPIESATTSGSR